MKLLICMQNEHWTIVGDELPTESPIEFKDNYSTCLKLGAYLGPRGTFVGEYFPVNMPSPRGLYAINWMPNSSHTAFTSICSAPLLSKEN